LRQIKARTRGAVTIFRQVARFLLESPGTGQFPAAGTLLNTS
jgi:hypothetical protein